MVNDQQMQNEHGSRWTQLTIFAATAIFVGAAYLLSDTIRAEAAKAAEMLTRGDLESLRDYIRSFGNWAPVVSILLLVFQALAAPIPGFVVVFANGLAFGLFWGWVFSLAGQVLAAALCFWIARTLGRGPTSAIVGRLGVESADRWFARWGAHAVLVTRIVPGMAFDAVSYAAGLTKMGFLRFIGATAIGTAPTTLLYAYLGERAPEVGWLLLAVSGVVTAAVAISVISRRRRVAEADGADHTAQVAASTPYPMPPAVDRLPVRWAKTSVQVTGRLLDESGWVRLAVVSLFGLLAYLVIGQIVEPGFTDYWGYLLVQITVITVAVIWLSHLVVPNGGFSWITYLIVIVAVYLDTFGNAAGMYARYDPYDKIVHAAGTAALAAASYDILAALHRRGKIDWPPAQRARAAVAAAMLLASGWEVYEFAADQFFETYRHAGMADTVGDLIADVIGGVAMSLLLWHRETRIAARKTAPLAVGEHLAHPPGSVAKR